MNDSNREELNKTQAGRLKKYLDVVPQDLKSQVLKKSKFTDKELDEYGFRERTKETLQVTSGFDESKMKWR